jgi:hypothetical protein
MRQLPVAHDDAKASSVEKGDMSGGNAVDDTGDTERIVLPVPQFAAEREPCFGGTVNIGIIPTLDLAVGPTGATERATFGISCCSKLNRIPGRL